jgi:hypothetical protein
VKKTLRKFFSPFFQMNIYDFSSILQQHNIVLIIRGPPAAALQDGRTGKNISSRFWNNHQNVFRISFAQQHLLSLVPSTQNNPEELGA